MLINFETSSDIPLLKFLLTTIMMTKYQRKITNLSFLEVDRNVTFSKNNKSTQTIPKVLRIRS